MHATANVNERIFSSAEDAALRRMASASGRDVMDERAKAVKEMVRREDIRLMNYRLVEEIRAESVKALERLRENNYEGCRMIQGFFWIDKYEFSWSDIFSLKLRHAKPRFFQIPAWDIPWDTFNVSPQEPQPMFNAHGDVMQNGLVLDKRGKAVFARTDDGRPTHLNEYQGVILTTWETYKLRNLLEGIKKLGV